MQDEVNYAASTRSIRPKGGAWHRKRRRVRKRDRICVICRAAAIDVIDHIRPLRIGGGNGIDNLRGLCASCDAEFTDHDYCHFWIDLGGEA
jgi:5-methylcytosine-specific restriction endonuclease McrA